MTFIRFNIGISSGIPPGHWQICKQTIAFFLLCDLLAGLPLHSRTQLSHYHKTRSSWLDLAWPRTQQSKRSTQILHTWSCILSGFSSAILCPYVVVHLTGKLLSAVLSCISSGTLSANLCGISSGIRSGILSGISSDILSGIPSGTLSGISSAFYLTFCLAFSLAYLLAFYLAYLLTFYLTFCLAFSLAYLPAYLLAFYLTFYPAYLLAFYLAVEAQRCALSWGGPRLRSSGAHWAGKVRGWGPAVHTELGRSQVEVPVHTELGSWQRAWRRELAKSLAKSWQGGSGGGSWCRHGRGETRGGGGRGRGGGQLAEEENNSDKI